MDRKRCLRRGDYQEQREAQLAAHAAVVAERADVAATQPTLKFRQLACPWIETATGGARHSHRMAVLLAQRAVEAVAAVACVLAVAPSILRRRILPAS